MTKKTRKFYTFYGEDPERHKRATLKMSRHFATTEDREEIRNFIEPYTRELGIRLGKDDEERTTTVNPGWRLAAYGKIARQIHSLFANGMKKFRIKRVSQRNVSFQVDSGFEVPYYEFIIKDFEVLPED